MPTASSDAAPALRAPGASRRIWELLAAADPGGNRLRLATNATVSLGCVLAIELGYGHALGLDYRHRLVAMMLGAVVAMVGSMGMAGSPREKLTLALGYPVAAGLGVAGGVLLDRNQDLMLVGFVLVMFVSVFVRRFGVPYFFYGMLAWVGYFMASFVKATESQLPELLGATVVAAASVLLLSVTLLRTDPGKALDRMLRAYGARARASLRAAATVLDVAAGAALSPADLADWHAAQHVRAARLAEVALMIDAWGAGPGALPPGRSAGVLRRELMEAQQALDEFVHAAEVLAGEGGSTAAAAARVADRLAERDHLGAEILARALLTAAGPDTRGTRAARRLAAAALEYVDLARSVAAGTAPEPEDSELFAPASVLMLGDVVGTPGVARGVRPRGRTWNPLTRLDLNGRQAFQAALAGAIAIAAGRMIDPTRYYWAAIAAFIVFTGTSTRAETSLKAANRVLGTVAGLFAAIGAAHLTGGRTGAVLAVVLVCLFCGFYLIKVSYAFLIFFITVMVGQMYVLLGTFSDHLLFLRLEETVLGATIGVLVALVVAPLSTRDTARAAESKLLAAVAEVLERTGTGADLDAAARGADNALHQLTIVSAPLTRPLLLGNDPGTARHRLTLFAAATSHARGIAAAGRRGPLPTALRPTAARLALAARALAEPGEDGRAAARAHLAAVDSTLFDSYASAARAADADPIALRADRALTHLMLLLRELAGVPAERAPLPAPGPGLVPLPRGERRRVGARMAPTALHPS